MTNTPSELKAYSILVRAGYYGSVFSTTDLANISHAGNKIIQLAEQIKAERAVISMNK